MRTFIRTVRWGQNHLIPKHLYPQLPPYLVYVYLVTSIFRYFPVSYVNPQLLPDLYMHIS